MEHSHKVRVNLLLGMTQGLRHSPVQFCLLPGERDSIISCYGPQAFLISGEMVMYFSISVGKLEKKQEQSSMGMSCNPVFQTLLLCHFKNKFTCTLESARTGLTNTIPVLASDQELWHFLASSNLQFFQRTHSPVSYSELFAYLYVVASALLHSKRFT